MPSYLITGVSRGLGYEFLRQLSSDPENTVIGLVRDKPATDKKLSEELKDQLSKVHILQADITDYDALKRAAEDTAKITNGSLDVIIANAALLSTYSSYDSIGVLGEQPKELEQELLDYFKTNVIANVHLFNVFLPLILKGETKKIIALSSGLADLEPTIKYNFDQAAPYTISKAALNIAVAKFSAQYAKDGVLFMSICPGSVNTGQYDGVTEEQMPRVGEIMKKLNAYAPHFTGPGTAESAVRDVLSVIDRSSVENGNGGTFVSHFGNKQWL